jgi:hypothetical protein
MTNSSSPISHGELRKIAADLKSGKIVFALGNAYPDYALGKEVAVMVSDLIESAISETGEHDNNLLAERRAYRKALEDIIAGGQEADAVAIAHTAITPYTPWKAVSE